MTEDIQAAIEDLYPLTPMQRGMLFHSLSQPESYAYLYQLTMQFEGEFDVAGFKWSWQEVVRRHSALRVSFLWEDIDAPLQVVHRDAPLPWRVFDWRRLSESEQLQRLKVFLETDRAEGINLGTAPVFRLALFHFSDHRRVLVFTSHHIQMDGWSQQIVFREVQEFYELWRKGSPLSRTSAPQFCEYIQWLRHYDMGAAEAFWRSQLQGFLAPTPLSFGLAGLTRQTDEDRLAHEELYLSLAFTASLKDAAQRRHLTLNTLLRAAWGYVLSRYSGEHDVVFGTTVSGRPPELDQVDRMVGLFINTIPVRIHLAESTLLSDWLAGIQRRQIEQSPFEYAPTAQIHQWSDIDRGSTLFETILVVENFTAQGRSAAPGGPTWVQSVERTHYPITVIVGLGESLHIAVPYESPRFAVAAIKRMIGHFVLVLDQMRVIDTRRIVDLQLLPPAEREQVLYEFNATGRLEGERSLLALVEEQVKATPGAIAVKYGTEELSYGELDERAERLAGRLVGAGVGAEIFVAVCLERSLELVVSLLGVLKSGGAYVPVDPEWPSERKKWILEDADPAVLVTETRLCSFADSSLAVICLDEDEQGIGSEGSRPMASPVSGKNAVYAIYTSGSTGRPKGVINTHEGVVNRLRWMQREFPSLRRERVVQKTPYTFDVSVWEFFWPLSTGGCIVMARPGGHRDPAYLLELIAREGITTIHFVPSMLRAFLQGVDEIAVGCGSLRRVICSGEELSKEVIEEFLRKAKGVELFNLYGPTEAAIDVTKWKCDADHISHTGSVPIGKPMQDCTTYILGPDLEPLPIGVVGDLYLGGIQLARGYSHQAALTAESFLPNPFSTKAGERLYRSGDMGCWDEEGNVEYRGRKDGQIKIRGYRVEVGEIEAALEGLEGVRQAAVVVREGGRGERRLVGYVVVEKEGGEEGKSGEEIRKRVKGRLPEYMVPGRVEVVEEMPLTGSGKVDRKELAKRKEEEGKEEGGGRGRERGRGARNEVERMIAEVWEEVLGVGGVGVEQNFFDLGGDSLSLLQVQGKLRGRWPGELTVTDLFRYPTISSLASTVVADSKKSELARGADESMNKVERVRVRMKQRLETRLGKD